MGQYSMYKAEGCLRVLAHGWDRDFKASKGKEGSSRRCEEEKL